MAFENELGWEYYIGMEARIAKVESAVEYIQRDILDIKQELRSMRKEMSTDFRILFGAIITLAIGLAGLMAKGFGWL